MNHLETNISQTGTKIKKIKQRKKRKSNSNGRNHIVHVSNASPVILGAIEHSQHFQCQREIEEEQQIERFCDAVAAAALMPAAMLRAFPLVGGTTGTRPWTDDELRPIGNAIGVSREALLLRFVTLGRATWDYYLTQRPRFQAERQLAAQKEGKKEVKIKRPVLLMSWNGRGYTRLVLRSYYDQRLTLNDVSSYLGAKVNHIPALEHAAFQMAE